MVPTTLRQYRPLPDNERLRYRLDDFYTCLRDCLDCYKVKAAFEEVCDALCKESDALLEELTSLEEQYREELPLDSEEPKNIVWMDERDHLHAWCEVFTAHEYAAGCEYANVLTEKLKSVADTIGRIDGQLYPEDDPDIYVSYCKRELANYVMGGWNRTLRDIRNFMAKAPANRRNKLMDSRLQTSLNDLRVVSDYIISEDLTTVYYEALGRHLWQIRHSEGTEQKIEDVMCLVKTAEFYSNKLQKKFIYLDGETSPEDEKDENVKLKHLMDTTRQEGVAMATMRLGFCKGFLAEDFPEGFVGEMLTQLLDTEYCMSACDKFSKRKVHKFIHQIAGVLMKTNVFVDCSYGDLADAMRFKNPRRDSRIDYIRHMIDDVPEIQAWIEEYIRTYRQGLREKSEQGVNVNR